MIKWRVVGESVKLWDKKQKEVKTDGEKKGYTDEEKLEMEQKKQQIEDKKDKERCGGWGDKQHRRKKMQVRHLVSPEAILQQHSAGVSLYE